MLGDYSLLRDMGIEGDGSRRDVKAHAEDYLAKYMAWYGGEVRGRRMHDLQRLERLPSLESLPSSYDEVELPDNAVVYCDPPYANTARYIGDFAHAKFYDWLRRQDRPIYVSEYAMPEDFVRIAERVKSVTLSAKIVNKAVERLYVHESQVDKIFIPTLF